MPKSVMAATDIATLMTPLIQPARWFPMTLKSEFFELIYNHRLNMSGEHFLVLSG